MPDSSTSLGIGSGLARGLASVLLNKRQQDTENQRIAEQRNAELHMALLPEVLKRAQSYDDIAPFIDQIAGVESGSGKKKGKNSGPDHHDVLSNLLGPLIQQNAQGSASGAQEGVSSVASALGDTPTAGAPAASRQTLLGVPMLSNEEVSARDTSAEVNRTKAIEGAKLDAATQGKIDAAARLRSLDPTMTLDDSLIAVGLKVPQDQFGTVASGGGVFNKTTGEITEPPSARFKAEPGPLGERYRVLLAKDGLTEEQVARSPEISTKYLTAAGKQLDEEVGLDRATKNQLAESLLASRNLALEMGTQRMGNLPTASDLQQNAKTITVGGKPYHFVSKGDFAGMDAQNAATNAGKAAGVLVVSVPEAAQLQAAQGAFSNLDTMYNQIKAKLPVDAQNRPLTALSNKMADVFQSDDDIAAFRTWNLEAFQLLSSLKDTGRISNQAFAEALKDRPQMTDTVGTAAKKIENLESLIGNTVKPILERGMGQSFSVSYNGKSYTFDTQAKLDAFKRQFPDAK